jgi:GH25 family lysozyme M1 (1,4-beta-N-acetylmuramidase)
MEADLTVYVADMGSQNPVDFVKLSKSGCVGVIHRATRSNQQTDPLYRSRRELGRANGLKWGAYAFNTGEPVADQVSRFVSFAMPAADESAWLDLERNPGGTGQMTLGGVVEFLDRVDGRLGRRCGLYSGDVIKSLVTKATDDQRDFLALHPLWGCEYGPRWRNVDANGHPLPWDKPFLWQLTGDDIGPEPHTLDGLEQGADLSVFDGTADDLRAQWALPVIQPTPVTA